MPKRLPSVCTKHDGYNNCLLESHKLDDMLMILEFKHALVEQTRYLVFQHLTHFYCLGMFLIDVSKKLFVQKRLSYNKENLSKIKWVSLRKKTRQKNYAKKLCKIIFNLQKKF